MFHRDDNDVGRLVEDSYLPEAVVYSRVSDLHEITVVDVGFRRMLRFGPYPQSSMYLDDAYETDFEYPAYFHIALAVCPDATRTLAIGLGGGTVVKRMWRDYPDMRIDVAETDPEVAAVARWFFALPDDPRVRVVIDDGRHFIEATRDTYDIVIVDAFDDYRIPASLKTPDFLRAARDRMGEGGVIVYNVIGSLRGPGSEPFRNLHRALSEVWRAAWVFELDEGVEGGLGNLIVLASDADVTTDGLRARIADRVGGRVSVPAFHLFGDDLRAGPFDDE